MIDKLFSSGDNLEQGVPCSMEKIEVLQKIKKILEE